MSEDSSSGPKKRTRRRMITARITLTAVEDGDKGKKGRPIKCVTINVSDSGVGIYTEKPLDKNSTFMIRSSKLRALGRHGIVKWCRKLAPGLYRAGMEVPQKEQESFSCAEKPEDFNAGE